MRNTPLLWPGWRDIAPTLSYEWKLVVLVSHWLPHCTRRTTCGECAFTSAPQTSWRCWYDRKASDMASASSGLLTWLLLFWLTTAAAFFLSVWTQLLTMLTVNSRSKLTNNANADHLFVSPFCSNYSSSARMTKYQHKVHSHCWLSSPKKS